MHRSDSDQALVTGALDARAKWVESPLTEAGDPANGIRMVVRMISWVTNMQVSNAEIR